MAKLNPEREGLAFTMLTLTACFQRKVKRPPIKGVENVINTSKCNKY